METFSFADSRSISDAEREKAIASLEEGRVLFLPRYGFAVAEEELAFFRPEIVHPKAKNISYNLLNHTLGKTACSSKDLLPLRNLLDRFAHSALDLLTALLPHYRAHVRVGRTSFRPVEAEGRAYLSYRKDDRLLHVDAFPANPVKGERILRLFTNVNPYGKARVWKLGEPFAKVVERMGPKLTPPLPGVKELLKFFHLTKQERSLYDHYMLQIHDKMKGDRHYQNSVSAQEVHFPPHSSWIVFSDQTSHAALAGQFLFEQTFYLPVEGQRYPERSPLRTLERYFGKNLT